MSKSIFAAVLAMGAAALLAAPASAARVDSGVTSSHYDGRTQKHRAKKYRSSKSYRSTKSRRAGVHTNKKAYRGKSAYKGKKAVGRKARLAKRSVTRVARSGGGASTSRSCLTPAARALLGRIEAQFGTVQIISTCRPGARIAGSGRPSKHASGNAVDFNAGGRKGAIVSWLRANHHSGGTMTYARMNHIHVDIGPRFVSLGAGGGKRKS